jgi:hypothetical protein
MIEFITPRVVRKVRLLSVAGGVGVLLIGGVLVSHQLALTALSDAANSDTQTLQLQTLEERMAALEQYRESAKRLPTAASQTDLVALQRTLDQRLETVESALAGRATADDLQTVRDQFVELTDALKAVQVASAEPKQSRRPSAKPPTLVAPPFQILGLESRGGERFLSVVQLNAQSLEHVQLLRVGDSFGDWQLDAIEQQAAVFRVDGQPRRLAIP